MAHNTKSIKTGINRARQIRADARLAREVIALRRRQAQLDAVLTALAEDRLVQIAAAEMCQRPAVLH